MEQEREQVEDQAKGRGIVFAVNGERFDVAAVDPSTTLLQFLRTRTRFKSVKLGCGEGGCGACLVLLSKYDSKLGRVEDYTVNSCLTLLCSVKGCSITTTEGLGSTTEGFHPIHQRFAGFHASQCGFCTPGICVSLFSALVNADKTCRPEAPQGFSKLTVSEAEKAISGNLCRCTGYRPLADVCKSFASDVDMEDLGFNSFWKKGETTGEKLRKLPIYDSKKQICTFPEFLKSEGESPMFLRYNNKSYYSPLTIGELHSLLETNLADNGALVKLVVGNTGTGYYKELDQYNKYIDLRFIPELSSLEMDDSMIKVGAAVSISKLVLALKEEKVCVSCPQGSMVFHKIASHMEKIASLSVRNSASVGGNLMMAQRNHFPSDIATILLGVDSKVSIMTGDIHETLTLEEFLARPAANFRTVLLSIQIPCCKPTTNGFQSRLLFETYRASPRPLGNAIAYLNAAFLADISPYESGVIINNIRLAFGAYGTKHANRACLAENFLAEKVLSVKVLSHAIKLVRAEISPEDGTSNPAYRSSLSVSFLFEFLLPLLDSSTPISDGDIDRHSSLLSSAKQDVDMESSQNYHPIGKPITKSGATIQASGEAVYVDDIPSPENCLHGAFIYSTKPLAWIKDVKFKSKTIPDGVHAVISSRDIPKGGENIGSRAFFSPEPLFANGLTECAGQRLAFVVADTQKEADMAAGSAIVDYDTENLDPPILTVEEAVAKSSFFEVPSFIYPSQVGDFLRGMAEADHKILSAKIKLGSQYYFYMETQTALAIPDEDNCILVYSSSQSPEYTHSVIARCLGVPENNVRVITRRVGGGFGGKVIRSMPVAATCALAAHKLRRPVRMYLNRKTDMIMAGGRHPMKITYSVGFKSDGKVTALHFDILILAGMSADISPTIPSNMTAALKKYDWGALSFDIKVCKTNHSTKSAMRAPGEVQGSFISEAIIEHIASVLSADVDSVRCRNIHTFDSLSLFYPDSAGEPAEYTLPSIWDKLAKSSSFYERMERAKQLNQRNKWKKLGIS